jgi:hypothetical protein
MLALHTLTIALTLSYARANPIVGGAGYRIPPAARMASDELVVRDLDGPSAIVPQYVPGPKESSLTRAYYEERATCVDQFVWYCAALGGYCAAALPALETPLAVFSVISCVLTAFCAGVRIFPNLWSRVNSCLSFTGHSVDWRSLLQRDH